MSDSPTEHVHESIMEEAREALESWISWAAATAAVLAALAAVTGELSNSRLTQSTRDQVQSNDSWGYYQAKSIKASVLRGKMETLAALNKPESEADRKKLEEYEHDLDQLKEQAEHQETTSEASLAAPRNARTRRHTFSHRHRRRGDRRPDAPPMALVRLGAGRRDRRLLSRARSLYVDPRRHPRRRPYASTRPRLVLIH